MSDPAATSEGEMPLHDHSDVHNVKLHHEDTDTIAKAAAVAADEALDDENPAVSHIEAMDEAAVLQSLTEGVRDQDDLQRDISHQANVALTKQDDERDQKRIDKAAAMRLKLDSQRRRHESRLNSTTNNLQRAHLRKEVEKLDTEIAGLDRDIADIQERIDGRHRIDRDLTENDQDGVNRRLPSESQREFLIRTGKITPFSKIPDRGSLEGRNGGLTEAMMDVEDEAELDSLPKEEMGELKSHQNLRMPGFVEAFDSGTSTPTSDEFGLRPRKRRRLQPAGNTATSTAGGHETDSAPSPRKSSIDSGSTKSFTPDLTESDMLPGAEEKEESDNDLDEIVDLETTRNRERKSKSKVKANTAEVVEDLTGIDDGNEEVYQSRLRSWVQRRSRARRQKLGDVEVDDTLGDGEEWFKPSPDAPDHQFENGLKLPGDIFPSLFDYQKTGVQWLGELYEQQTGGIVGDEMGLGKTIQIISFIAALHYSKKLKKPVIVVAPATVLRQWVNECHRWWPPLRVSILHTSGSGMLNLRNEGRLEEEEQDYRRRHEKKPTKGHKAAKRIVDRVVEHGHILVTTYAGLQTYSDLLIPVKWGYSVLDEGHKIRNPNTAITIYCKELQTPNRIILSGTPMQNNLVELWSLFDFVYPMRLGTLVNFRNQFEIPIKLGGYANATNLQVLTATKCAETLKDAISPYLLARVKADVAADLPKKSEQVLFCKLTKPQREAYELFLASDEMRSILSRTRQSLYGIDILRKICNHPDLLDKSLRGKPGYKWGNPNKSGKMQVVKALLELWKRAGDKTLLFSQGVQMLNIIEDFVKRLPNFKYLRMDGTTNIADRQTMVDQFNNDPDLDLFLLTTKVGGLGVNLTGANRVIIFDPDWNPSTDIQARERAWRLGQKKEVTIYRLMTAGTIEEKIYHRQIFKQFLTDKIMKDPKQRQTFHMKDLYDLFTLGSSMDDTTETGQMFEGSEMTIKKDSGEIPDTYPTDENLTGETAVTEQSVTRKLEDDSVRQIMGVSKLEKYRGDPNEEKDSTDDSRIMEGLFARSGVTSVLQHDHIVNGKRVVQADRGMLEREAKRIAAEGAAELRRASEAARQVPIGIVTWTGQVGEAGRPRTVRRGPASSGILANLSNRQGISPAISSAGSSRAGTPRTNASGFRGKDYMKLIKDYLAAQGGSAPSQSIVVHFNSICQSEQQITEFKTVLKEIAELRQNGRGRMRGRWELKEQYK